MLIIQWSWASIFDVSCRELSAYSVICHKLTKTHRKEKGKGVEKGRVHSWLH